MNTREIERMWKQATECPHHDTNWYDPMVVEFAALVAAAERERLAQSIEQMPFGDTATSFAVYVRNFK